MQMSLGQQLNMCSRFNLNNNAALSLLMGTTNTGSSPVLGNWLQNEIIAQKQQQQRMLQLQQLTAVNLRQQSRKPRSKNNFRASAA